MCSGRAVGLGLLQRTVAKEVVDQIWAAAREQRVARGRPCPSCHDPMHEVSSGPSGPAVDVCRVCHFVWLDPTEYEQIPAIPAAPPAEPVRPERATEILATAQAEAIAQRAERSFGAEAPRELWKYLPALLGMPVECEQSVFHSVPWLTWALIAFICAFSIRAFSNIEAAVTQFGLVPTQYARYFGLTFLTSFLLHGNLGHLVGNMYFLYVFGDNVEDFLGKGRYLALILIAAVLGDVAHIVMDPRSNVPLIGARRDLWCHCLLRVEIPENEDGRAISDLANSHPVVPYPRVCLRRILDPTAVLRGLPADCWGELRVRTRTPGRSHDRAGLLVDLPAPH